MIDRIRLHNIKVTQGEKKKGDLMRIAEDKDDRVASAIKIFF